MNKRNRPRLILVIASLAFFLCQGAMCPEKNNGKGERKEARAVPGITAVGGNGVNGSGGAGGRIAGSWQPEFSIRSDGAVDTSFSVPMPPQPDLGPNSWVVTKDYQVNAYDCDTWPETPAEGEYFMCVYAEYNPDRDGIFLMRSGPQRITGIKVKKGVTLTLALNTDMVSPSSALDTAYLMFSNDVIVNGTITSAGLDTAGFDGSSVEIIDGLPATSRDKGALYLATMSGMFINGLVDAAGQDGILEGERGGRGGQIHLYGDQSAWLNGVIDCSGGDGGPGADGGPACGNYEGISYMWPPRIGLSSYLGTVVQRGQVLARGGAGRNGGMGAEIILYAAGKNVYNLGLLDASGGEGLEGNGGPGGWVGLGDVVSVDINSMGAVYNRGKIFANGGDARESGVGSPVEAGAGGRIGFRTRGAISLSGLARADGGNAYGWGHGGAGGFVSMMITNPFGGCSLPETALRSNLILQARGGAGAGEGGRGGIGGIADYAGDLIGPDYQDASVKISDQVDVSGGDGDIGGDGGLVELPRWLSFCAPPVEFVGFQTPIMLDGGFGINGGNGGSVNIFGENIEVSIPVLAGGGDGDPATGAGGDGGSISLNSSSPPSILDPGFDVSGGPAATPGAEGTVTVDGSVIYP